MRIAVVGAGAVGRALGPRWIKAGHDVVYGVRTTGTEDMASFLARTGGREELGAEAVRGADIVVLALPWAKAEAAVRGLGDISEKIVIDCMNPLEMRDGVLDLACGFDTSGAEHLATWIRMATQSTFSSHSPSLNRPRSCASRRLWELSMSNKFAVITGAGRGFGRSMALNLARQGLKPC
jgi:hypothetical protein